MAPPVEAAPATAWKRLWLCTNLVRNHQWSYRGFDPAADQHITLLKVHLQRQHHLH